MEFNVSRVVVHPRYSSINLQNNIAIMKLSSAVPLGLFPSISTACLGCKEENSIISFEIILQFDFPATPILAPMRCWVSGKFYHIDFK